VGSLKFRFYQVIIPTKILIELKLYMNRTKNLIKGKLYMNPTKNLIEDKLGMNPTKILIEPKLCPCKGYVLSGF
jgi:hypothetical protein